MQKESRIYKSLLNQTTPADVSDLHPDLEGGWVEAFA